MAFHVYCDNDYQDEPNGRVIYEPTKAAAIREYVGQVRGRSRLPHENESFQGTPMGETEYVALTNVKAAFKVGQDPDYA